MSAPLAGTVLPISIYPLNSDPANGTGANFVIADSAGQYAYFADAGAAPRVGRINLATGTAALFSTGGTFGPITGSNTPIFWKPGSGETVLLIYANDGKVHECPLSTGLISAGVQTTESDNSPAAVTAGTVTYLEATGTKVLINGKNVSLSGARLLDLSTLKFQLDPLKVARVPLGTTSRTRRPLAGKIWGNIGNGPATAKFSVCSVNLDPLRASELRFEFGLPAGELGAVALPTAAAGQVLNGLTTAEIPDGENWFVSDPDGTYHYGSYQNGCLYRFDTAANTATLISKASTFPSGSAWFIPATNKIIVTQGTGCCLIS